MIEVSESEEFFSANRVWQEDDAADLRRAVESRRDSGRWKVEIVSKGLRIVGPRCSIIVRHAFEAEFLEELSDRIEHELDDEEEADYRRDVDNPHS